MLVACECHIDDSEEPKRTLRFMQAHGFEQDLRHNSLHMNTDNIDRVLRNTSLRWNDRYQLELEYPSACQHTEREFSCLAAVLFGVRRILPETASCTSPNSTVARLDRPAQSTGHVLRQYLQRTIRMRMMNCFLFKTLTSEC